MGALRQVPAGGSGGGAPRPPGLCAQSSTRRRTFGPGETIGTWKCVAPSAAALSMLGRLSNAVGTPSAVVGNFLTSRAWASIREDRRRLQSLTHNLRSALEYHGSRAPPERR